MEPELQRGKVIYPKSYSQREVDPGCELSVAESAAAVFVPLHPSAVGGRAVVHPEQLFDTRFSLARSSS